MVIITTMTLAIDTGLDNSKTFKYNSVKKFNASLHAVQIIILYSSGENSLNMLKNHFYFIN